MDEELFPQEDSKEIDEELFPQEDSQVKSLTALNTIKCTIESLLGITEPSTPMVPEIHVEGAEVHKTKRCSKCTFTGTVFAYIRVEGVDHGRATFPFQSSCYYPYSVY